MKLISTESLEDQIYALQREIVAYSWMLGLFGLTMLVFAPVLFKVIQTHHQKDPVFMAMLILLQLTLAAYLYFFGFYIVLFKSEIAD